MGSLHPTTTTTQLITATFTGRGGSTMLRITQKQVTQSPSQGRRKLSAYTTWMLEIRKVESSKTDRATKTLVKAGKIKMKKPPKLTWGMLRKQESHRHHVEKSRNKVSSAYRIITSLCRRYNFSTAKDRVVKCRRIDIQSTGRIKKQILPIQDSSGLNPEPRRTTMRIHQTNPYPPSSRSMALTMNSIKWMSTPKKYFWNSSLIEQETSRCLGKTLLISKECHQFLMRS